MESSPLFDLNEAIQRWRECLVGQRTFGADDLEELENHLRESVSELHAGGLGIGEAFLIAAARLGSAQRLAEEYAKTNARRIWTARAAWTLGGVVASLSMAPVLTTVVGIGSNLCESLGLHARLIVTLNLLIQWTICASGIGLGWWLLARRNRWVTSTVSKCFQRPVWTGAVLVPGLLVLQILFPLVTHWWQRHHPAGVLSPTNSAHLRSWLVSVMALNRLACIATIPLLASYLWKATRTETASPPVLPFDRPQSNERGLAGQLEAQGLSRSESHLVIAWQRGFRPVSGRNEPRFISGIWLERGFWMIVGMVANWMVQDFVERPSWVLVHSESSSSLLLQHFSGLVSMCLPLTFVSVAIVAFWNVATGAQRQNRWVARVFGQSPVRGAMLFASLAVLCVTWSAYLSLVRPADAQFPIMAHGGIAITWWAWKIFLTSFVLPIVLLVWLGNRYQTEEESA